MGTVVDTVVAQYFLLVDEFELLLDLLDPPVVVPSIVFDPEDVSSVPAAQSELRKAIAYYGQLAADASSDDVGRRGALRNVKRLQVMDEFMADGRVEMTELSPEEQHIFRQLMSVDPPPAGRISRLGAGEAACLAIALERGYVLATDDTDALAVLNERAHGHQYERIRKLLIRAAKEGRITRSRANEIHTDMREHGFWDRQSPFPAR